MEDNNTKPIQKQQTDDFQTVLLIMAAILLLLLVACSGFYGIVSFTCLVMAVVVGVRYYSAMKLTDPIVQESHLKKGAKE